MKAIQALIPSDNNFFVAIVIETLATHYFIDMKKLRAELLANVVQDGIEKLRERKSSRNTNDNSDSNHEMVEDEEQFIQHSVILYLVSKDLKLVFQ